VCIRKGKELFNFVEAVDQWKKVKGKPSGKYTQRSLPEGIKLDLFMADKNNWGLILAIRTGSARFSHKELANRWVAAGYTSRSGMLTKGDKTIPLPEEKDLFDLLKMPWVHPRERE
jgi:DNA polymerase/3'-5' exonuclease PolX